MTLTVTEAGLALTELPCLHGWLNPESPHTIASPR
jgi:hypothetical protein